MTVGTSSSCVKATRSRSGPTAPRDGGPAKTVRPSPSGSRTSSARTAGKGFAQRAATMSATASMPALE